MRGEKTFSLDIHEKAHGPHGLVAGTTGSGKSELLQAWILSMAITFHPHDVVFVLIDYKGGGMANLLAPLPHVIIVADEFAELKKEEPEFMSGLVSASRVGRSLGIHLILATRTNSRS